MDEDTDRDAERVEYLIGLIENTRDLVLRLAVQITGTEPGHEADPGLVWAARTLQEMRGPLAMKEVEAETIAAKGRARRRMRRMEELAAARERPALRAVPRHA